MSRTEDSGKILIMEDEKIVRDVVSEMLKSMGFEVEVAVDGEEALKTYKKAREDGEPFDAVIMDLTIPGGMGGKETIKKMREVDPRVKVVVSSGYSNDPIMANFREYGFADVVAKPYKIDKLSEVLRKLLAE